MATWRPMLRSALPPVVVTAVVAVGSYLWLAPWYLNYDTRYAILWGRDLVRGFSPEYSAAFAPTPHPLWTGMGALAQVFGSHADLAMAWVVLASFGAMVWLTYALGAQLFNRWVGLVAAAVVLTRPAMNRDVLLAYLDVPFAALVIGAILLEARKPRRGVAVLAVLAIAGLIRPDAWALSFLYVAYLWRGLPARERARLLGLAAIGPVLWFLCDAVVTGDALHSLHGTATLADENDRRRSVSQVPYWTVKYFIFTLRQPVILGLPVGLLFAWRRGLRGARLPLLAVAALVAVFAVGPVFGLPLIGRYIRTPSALLALFYGLACFGWLSLAPSPARRRWALAGIVCLALSAAYIPRQADLLHGTDRRSARDGAFYDDLRKLAQAPRVRAAFAACPKVTATDHRPIPFLRWWLGGNPGSVSTTEKHAAPLAPLYVIPRRSRISRSYYGINYPRRARPPAGYVLVSRDRSWRMYATPRCVAG